MAKEVKNKKVSESKAEPVKEEKETKDVSYFNSLGLYFSSRDFRVVLNKIGSDGSIIKLDEYKTSSRGEALEVYKLWAINKICDNVIKNT